MKKVLAIILCVTLIFTFTSCGTKSRSIRKYEKKRNEIEYATEFMPSIDDLDGYTDINCSHKWTYFLFDVDTLSLFVEYPSEIYKEKKADVLSSYEFLEETIISDDGDEYLSTPARFEYGGYSFKTAPKLDIPRYAGCAHKSFAFIGFNDDKNRIAYCYFYDFHLDLIGLTNFSEQEMATKYIEDYFYWNDLP